MASSTPRAELRPPRDSKKAKVLKKKQGQRRSASSGIEDAIASIMGLTSKVQPRANPTSSSSSSSSSVAPLVTASAQRETAFRKALASLVVAQTGMSQERTESILDSRLAKPLTLESTAHANQVALRSLDRTAAATGPSPHRGSRWAVARASDPTRTPTRTSASAPRQSLALTWPLALEQHARWRQYALGHLSVLAKAVTPAAFVAAVRHELDLTFARATVVSSCSVPQLAGASILILAMTAHTIRVILPTSRRLTVPKRGTTLHVELPRGSANAGGVPVLLELSGDDWSRSR